VHGTDGEESRSVLQMIKGEDSSSKSVFQIMQGQSVPSFSPSSLSCCRVAVVVVVLPSYIQVFLANTIKNILVVVYPCRGEAMPPSGTCN
jgi:hypothetical protein